MYFKLQILQTVIRARDAKGLVLFGLFGQKNRSEAEPSAARLGAQKNKKTFI